jgi:hypothetical protein
MTCTHINVRTDYHHTVFLFYTYLKYYKEWCQAQKADGRDVK